MNFKNLGFLLKKNSVRSASLILMITLVASNILGLFRNRFLAQKIPPQDLDTYLAAFRIPDLLFNLLILGAISSAFIPVFCGLLAKNKKAQAWKVTNSITNFVLLSLTIIPAIIAIFMPQIVPLIVPGFSDNLQHQTINLSRLLLLTPIFFGVSYILGGILNSYRRFLIYSLSPLIYNFSIILATLLLANKWGIYGVILGVVIGAFFHMLIQIPVAVKLGYKWQPILNLRDPAVKKIAKLMIPRVIGLGAGQFVLIAITFLASAWKGNVTYFNFANDIQTFFSVVFGASFAIAVFPVLSAKAAQKNHESFLKYFSQIFKQTLFFIIPSSVLLILLRAEIVRLTLGTGHFGWEATVTTANVLAGFALGIWSASLIQLGARAFYALKDTRTPTIAAVISAVLTIILSIFLCRGLVIGGRVIFPELQVFGLSLAVSAGSILNFILLMIYLKRKIGGLEGLKLLTISGKYLLAAAILGLVVQMTKVVLGSFVNMQTFTGVFIKTAGATILGFLVYWLITYLFDCDEFTAFFKVLKKRVQPPPEVPVIQEVGTKQSQQE